MTILPKANYRLNAIHIKIPIFFAEIKNPFLNSCGITRDTPIVKTIFLEGGGWGRRKLEVSLFLISKLNTKTK